MTENELYLFDLQGYLVVEDALTAEQVAAWNALLDDYLSREMEPNANTKRFSPKVFAGNYTELIDNSRITPYLGVICGESFRLDHDYVDVIRSGLGPVGATLHGGGTPYDPSQYYIFRNNRMYNGLTVVAYNLRDVNPGDGGFGCIPGSHKSNLPLPSDWRGLEQPHPCVRAATGKAGSAVIFTEALTHGTLPWQGVHERRTLFFKYCPSHMAWSRKYYNPNDYGGLTESQQRILRVPGAYPA